MLVSKLTGILIIFTVNYIGTHSKETTCIINGKKAVNTVSERFLSFSIDPATLLTGLNTSSASTLLAKHLSPAFLRISGPSTQYVQFSESEATGSPLSVDSLLTVTPQMWKSFNQWTRNANLTPVFAINDKGRAWDPKPIIPFLDINYKMDFDCFWQLGYGCGYKSLTRYKEDLMTLKHVLEAYPPAKVVGSNLRSCFSSRNVESLQTSLEDLEGVADAIVWEQKSNRGDISMNPSRLAKPYMPIWLVLPKVEQPVTFASGLLWAKQIGEAAKEGYEVVFRQPRLHELFTDTPVFWISLLHKTLMGRNVLDVKTNSVPIFGSYVYAHCSKRQNRYSRQGAMTVFIVNTGNYDFAASIRVASNHPKSIDVQSYIVTSDDENWTSTYLNGEKLTMDILKNEQLLFIPKLRRVRVNKLLNLNVPAKSVSFFVLPGASISVCINREDETNLFMQEMGEDQSIDFSVKHEDNQVQSSRRATPLSDLYNLIKQELDADEQYYKTTHKQSSNIEKKRFPNLKRAASLDQELVGNALTSKDFRQHLVSKNKVFGNSDMTTDFNKYLANKNQVIGSSLTKKDFRKNNRANKNKLIGKSLGPKDADHYSTMKNKLFGKSRTAKEDRQFLLGKNKILQWKKHNKPVQLEIVFTERPSPKFRFSNHSKKIELHLTNNEIRKILTDRAKSEVAAKNIDVTSRELETAMTKASVNLNGKESTTLATRPKHKRFITLKTLNQGPNVGAKRKLIWKGRERRDINMELLRRSMQEKPSLEKIAVKQPATKKFGQNSREKMSKHHDIFPDAAESWESDELPSKSHTSNFNLGYSRIGAKSHLVDFMQPVEKVVTDEDDLQPGEQYIDERIQFLMGPGRIDSAMEEDLTSYHTFQENLDSNLFLNPALHGKETWKTKKPQHSNEKANQNEVKAFLTQHTDKSRFRSPRRSTKNDFSDMILWETIDQANTRFKRNINITNGDIKNYKKFMAEQLRTMKRARKQEEGKKATVKSTIVRSRTKPIQIKFNDEDSPDGEHLHIVIGKPYDPAKANVSERRRDAQTKLLKQWLENRKKKNEKLREKKKKQEMVPEDESDKSRKKRSPYNFKTSDVYVPKAQRSNSIIKRYTLNKMQKKPWKPQDLLKIKRTPSYSVEDLDNREFFHRTAPMLKQTSKGDWRHKRNIDSSENMIEDHHFNSIPKLKGRFKDLDEDLYSPTDSIRTEKNVVNDISSLNSENVETAESSTSTLLTSLEHSVDTTSFVTETSTIDYCTSGFAKNVDTQKSSNTSAKATNTSKSDATEVVDTIITYMTNLFQNIFGNFSSLIES